MTHELSVKCIDRNVCAVCPEMDLEIEKLKLCGNGAFSQTINTIYCTHYEKCSLLLRFLNDNKEDINTELDYIGRDGD